MLGLNLEWRLCYLVLTSQESHDGSNSLSELRVLVSRILLRRQVGKALWGGPHPPRPHQGTTAATPESRQALLLCGKPPLDCYTTILLVPSPDLTRSHLLHRSPVTEDSHPEEGTKGPDCHLSLLPPAPGLGLAHCCPGLGLCWPSLLWPGPPLGHCTLCSGSAHPPLCSQAVASPWRSLPVLGGAAFIRVNDCWGRRRR